ncbi:bifunctional folylpolyglutamate synthase/dihydrofolate synthase [Candidatus Woesearchaeota archaeon CG10_big_fil_rev_8_21_14_0_10_34_8]|nr:MAG: bifunctional folylpolyglutamate synthase/dihydrofolate synthase [Candidatus Woesearchaeota archaeon CG10_big_fil_rev_8_21_14_0_10_34_8]
MFYYIIMNFNQAVDYLVNLGNDREEWDLDLINELLHKLKMPHRRIGTVIHITGSNGKGSVCAMVANILKTAGYKVGLYTSPHLRRITERIKINNEDISKEVFSEYVQRIRPFVNGQSYFEVLTAIAFMYFADNDVEFSIIEVGLGGRLDATNVVESDISVITNVSLEHTKRLGENEEKIALEKAGIIKENSICVTGAEGDALKVIERVCSQRNTELLVSRPTDFSRLGLKGDVQKDNAGTAIKIIKALKRKEFLIPKLHILEGLESVKWPGRLEFISPRVLVDVAHNPAGALYLANELKKFHEDFERVVLVFGVLADKDWKSMLDYLVSVVDEIILTKPNSERAAQPALLERYLVKQFSLTPLIVENVKMAFDKAKTEAGKKDLVVVTGSFYTVGEIYHS